MTDKWQVSLTSKKKKNQNLFKSIRKTQVEKMGKSHVQHFIKMKHKGGEFMNKCFH